MSWLWSWINTIYDCKVLSSQIAISLVRVNSILCMSHSQMYNYATILIPWNNETRRSKRKEHDLLFYRNTAYCSKGITVLSWEAVLRLVIQWLRRLSLHKKGSRCKLYSASNISVLCFSTQAAIAGLAAPQAWWISWTWLVLPALWNCVAHSLRALTASSYLDWYSVAGCHVWSQSISPALVISNQSIEGWVIHLSKRTTRPAGNYMCLTNSDIRLSLRKSVSSHFLTLDTSNDTGL